MDTLRKKQISGHRGFTLMEILIVLILMSLIMGISTAFFANTLPKTRHRAAAREIVSTIKYARHLAAAKNERQVVTFDLDRGAYGIKGRTGKILPEDTELVIYDSGLNAEPIRKGQYSIAYDSTGAAQWDAIQLTRGQKTIRIKADPLLTAFIAHEDRD